MEDQWVCCMVKASSFSSEKSYGTPSPTIKEMDLLYEELDLFYPDNYKPLNFSLIVPSALQNGGN